MTADQKLVKQSWQKAYKDALDADIWGQADDAHDNYYKSAAHLNAKQTGSRFARLLTPCCCNICSMSLQAVREHRRAHVPHRY